MNKTFLKWLDIAEKKKQIKKTLVFQLFWGEEDDLIEQAAVLVQQRKFTEVMRIGLKVIPALMSGNLDPLFEAFPWVRAEFLKYMEELQPKPVVSEATLAPDVEKYLQEILEKLDKPQSAPKPLSGNSSGIKPIGGLKPLAALPLDDEDDEDLLVAESLKGDGSATQKFLAGFLALKDYDNSVKTKKTQ